MNATLNAVYDKDLELFLTNLNLLDKIKNGKIKCKFTKEIITLENFYAVFPEEGTIKVVSDSPKAIRLLSEYSNEKDIS